MITVKCPYCGEEIKLSEDMAVYDWDETTSEDLCRCQACQSLVRVEVEAKLEVVNIESYAESQSLAQERWEQYQEMKYDAEKEELLD